MRFTEFHLRFVFGILRSTHSTACKYVHRKCAKKAEQLQLFTFFLRQIICQHTKQQTRTKGVWSFVWDILYRNRIVCIERRVHIFAPWLLLFSIIQLMYWLSQLFVGVLFHISSAFLSLVCLWLVCASFGRVAIRSAYSGDLWMLNSPSMVFAYDYCHRNTSNFIWTELFLFNFYANRVDDFSVLLSKPCISAK